MERSILEAERLKYEPQFPVEFNCSPAEVELLKLEKTHAVQDEETLRKIFTETYGLPLISFKKGTSSVTDAAMNIGVILSGGQAAGGHNVITGLYDSLKAAHTNSKLIGFLGGPSGLIENKYIELSSDIIQEYRNTGGFDMIGSGRTKIETPEQIDAAIKTVKTHRLDGLVIAGGDDSNTNAAILAETFLKRGLHTSVVGIPKTIDNDLKGGLIECSFGFDTATKVYSELIGNICRDAKSAKKYWHFIKVMGRSASHIALECELKTHANICLIGEEVLAKNMTLKDISSYIADVIAKRAEKGENFGIVIVPEGLIEFIPEVNKLIAELNDLLGLKAQEFERKKTYTEQQVFLNENLTKESRKSFEALPEQISRELLIDRDPHGNVQVSRIATEQLLITTVKEELDARKKKGTYKGKFSSYAHFFGYEGRCAFPSNFDADYCYSLGKVAFYLLVNKCTGYIACVTNLSQPREKWHAYGIPLTSMMNIEKRKGVDKPVIKKSLISLDDPAFKLFEKNRERWAINCDYVYPGAIQYFGPAAVTDAPSISTQLNSRK